MLKKVHLRLTFFCALVIGLALLGMTLFCLWVSEGSARRSDFADFQKNSGSLITSIASQSMLSHTWLSQMEHTYDIRIDIRDNGQPLLYGALRYDETYAALFELVRETAAADYRITPEALKNHTLPLSESFSVRAKDGRAYDAAAALIPKKSGHLDVAILHLAALPDEWVLRQRLFFGGGAFAVWLLLVSAAAWLIRRLLRPVEESRQKQMRFIAAASHELRSPLTVMLASLSAARIASPKERERFFDNIESEGKRMARLIGDMLTLASSDAQSWSIHPQETEADTLLLEAYEKHEEEARQKDLRFRVSLPEEGARCLCDRERILQVLSILIDNAFSYTPSGGCVSLSLDVSERRIAWSVADNGPGIPKEQQEKIFERFYRADGARSGKEHFGLGLSVAKEIVSLHRGTIDVKNAPDGGAVFTVSLPLARPSR